MTDDELFRMLAVAIIVGFLPVGVYYRFHSVTSEMLDRWQEGPFILFGLRLSGLPWFIGTVAWMIDPQQMAWSSLPAPSWLRWCGLALIVLWEILLVWTFRNLSTNLTDTVVTRANHTLVTTGPYRFVRHPFYLAFVIALIGISMASSNWLLFASGLLPLGFLVARTRIEEEKLIERFGDEYRSYMQRVGRFFPRLPSRTGGSTASRSSP